MASGNEDLSVLILTEDSSGQAFSTVLTVAKKSFQYLAPNLPTQRIDFVPLFQPKAKRLTRGNSWKEKQALGKQKELAKEIAAHIARPDGVVIFHIDADRVWKRGKPKPASENVEKFSSLIIPMIRIAFEENKGRPGFDWAATAIEERIGDRLFLMVPYYSIEAWLFLNIETMRSVCKRLSERDSWILEQWDQDPRLIEETEKVKNSLSLGSQENALLAQRISASRCVEHSESYSEFIEALRGSDFLIGQINTLHLRNAY